MLKAFLNYLASHFNISPNTVKKAVRKHMEKTLNDAEKRVKEDIKFHEDQFHLEMENAVTRLLEGKDGAVARQVNAILSRM